MELFLVSSGNELLSRIVREDLLRISGACLGGWTCLLIRVKYYWRIFVEWLNCWFFLWLTIVWIWPWSSKGFLWIFVVLAWWMISRWTIFKNFLRIFPSLIWLNVNEWCVIPRFFKRFSEDLLSDDLVYRQRVMNWLKNLSTMCFVDTERMWDVLKKICNISHPLTYLNVNE
jgi:hypothetical protein